MGIDIGLYRIRIGLFSMPIKTGFKLRVLCVKRLCVSVVLRLAIALSLLTLLGGDVEKKSRAGHKEHQTANAIVFSGTSVENTAPAAVITTKRKN
ncbi:hypothetical protein DPMN_121702 [Dreissena polymorpha]|uniref:Uncharacterized protein n=1 Tax=Dreissena polymorpha TaxID=45954 RepID=A0A9D4GQJ7_DREPO|nr:hypothetical protein DPMN_121702 [Dreissena polymorpha]